MDELGEVAMEKVTAPIEPAGKVTRSSNGYSMDGRLNDSFRAVNLLFDKGVAVRRVDKAVGGPAPRRFPGRRGFGIACWKPSPGRPASISCRLRAAVTLPACTT